MKPVFFLTAATWLFPAAVARFVTRETTSSGCHFTLKSLGRFAGLVSQLADGPFRLNASAPTANFYLDASGGITDSRGFGCIVRDPPTTQILCGQGNLPATGFSIDASKSLLYHGSGAFWACPGTDTEYNVYVNPDFNQSKCFAIALTASGCGTLPAASSCLPATTVWETQTQTVTQGTTLTVTVAVTSPATTCCSDGFPPPDRRSSGSHAEAAQAKRDLSRRAPGDLNRAWMGIRDAALVNTEARRRWVEMNEIRVYDLVQGESAAFATAEYFGCTVFTIHGPGKIVVGHMAQNNGERCALASPDLTERILIERISRVVGVVDRQLWVGGQAVTPECSQLYVVITGSERDNDGTGVPTLKEWFVTGGVPPENIRYIYYGFRNPTAENGDPVAMVPVNGRSLFQFNSFGDALGAQVSIYLSHEEPRLYVDYDGEWGVSTVTWADSDATTTG
ncbi:hypothetical protein C8A00DRAFT_33814 [Chaetomidium leptoderma]|uniref:Cell wall mannoprotein PIR1-like C-terminal domain-containing protein n=1 Tax=Chaetomidium leptoderma TaxID=669021 RepID=A0AAN6VKW7_9PEZI|nr:hypothetical protein C8A00DRAFT_33814 [Chaetomidium leptoderma]